MRTNLIVTAVSAACASAMLSMAGPVLAQSGSGVTRAEVQAECANFMKTHEWSETKSAWVLKPGVKAPARNVKTSAQIEAETAAFLKVNRWDEAKSRFVPIKGAPRDVSMMTREEVKKETAAFLQNYEWDDVKSAFVSCK